MILLRGNSRSLSGLSTSLFSVDPSETDTTEVLSVHEDEASREESHSSAENSSENGDEESDSFWTSKSIKDETPSKKRQRGLIVISDSEDEDDAEGRVSEEGSKYLALEESPSLKSVRSSVTAWSKLDDVKDDDEEDEPRPMMVRASTSVGGGRKGLRGEWSFLAPVHAKNDDLREHRPTLRMNSLDKIKVDAKKERGSEEGAIQKTTNVASAPPTFTSKSRLIRRAIYSSEDGNWRKGLSTPSEIVIKRNRSNQLKKDGDEVNEDQAKLKASDPEGDVESPEVVVEIRLGNLTDEAVDAIVNAANSYLQHGGGVAGAISAKGGPGIQRESSEIVRRNGALDVGHCCHTRAYNIEQCKYVIHTVGPIYEKRRSHGAQEAELYSAVFRSLILADTLELSSISLPAISSGIFGFPKDDVARVLIAAAMDFASGSRPSIFTSNKRPKNDDHNGDNGDDDEDSEEDDLTEAKALLRAIPRVSRPPRFLRVIRLTNFDNPTVQFFSTRFDEIF